MRRTSLALLLALSVAAPTAFGQVFRPEQPEALPVTLTADSVSYDRETGQLVAAGNVEALYRGRVLRATRIAVSHLEHDAAMAFEQLAELAVEVRRRHCQSLLHFTGSVCVSEP